MAGRLAGRAMLGAMTALAALTLAAPAPAESDLFAFRHDLVAKAAHGVNFDHPELTCRLPLTATGDLATPMRISFLAEQAKPTEAWAVSGFPITHLSDLWTGGKTSYDPGKPPTTEWGWVYDRNGDGKADWLAYVADAAVVLPRGGFQPGFPNLAKMSPEQGVKISNEQLKALQENGRMTYVSFVDSNFDGVIDHALIVPYNRANGWGEGAMQLTLTGTRVSACQWRSDYDPTDTRPCAADAEGNLVTSGAPPLREARKIPAQWITFAQTLLRAVNNCDFGTLGLARHP